MFWVPLFKINPDCDLCWYLTIRFFIYLLAVSITVRRRRENASERASKRECERECARWSTESGYMCICIVCALKNHFSSLTLLMHTIFNWMEASESAASIWHHNDVNARFHISFSHSTYLLMKFLLGFAPIDVLRMQLYRCFCRHL